MARPAGLSPGAIVAARRFNLTAAAAAAAATFVTSCTALKAALRVLHRSDADRRDFEGAISETGQITRTLAEECY